MREYLDRLLCESYSALVVERHMPTSQSAMGRKFTCDDGWFDLIDLLCTEIQLHVDRGIEQPVCAQVKEKWGQLKFYLRSGANTEVLEMIQLASERSATICEICGEPGELMLDGGLVQTVCPKHATPTAKPLPER